MKSLKVKEILELNEEKLNKMMTDEQHNRMLKLGMKDVWELVDLLQDGVKMNQSDYDLNDDYTTIDEFLEYLEDISNAYDEN